MRMIITGEGIRWFDVDVGIVICSWDLVHPYPLEGRAGGLLGLFEIL